MSNEIMTVEQRIKRGFYEDLFLMLANTDRRQITAREVAVKPDQRTQQDDQQHRLQLDVVLVLIPVSYTHLTLPTNREV